MEHVGRGTPREPRIYRQSWTFHTTDAVLFLALRGGWLATRSRALGKGVRDRRRPGERRVWIRRTGARRNCVDDFASESSVSSGHGTDRNDTNRGRLRSSCDPRRASPQATLPLSPLAGILAINGARTGMILSADANSISQKERRSISLLENSRSPWGKMK